MNISETVTKVLDWAVAVDQDKAKAAVAGLRRDYPSETADQLAERVCWDWQCMSAAGGVATGVVSNPLVAAGAAVADAAMTLRTQVEMAARVALCHDADHFTREGALEELLVPIMGAGAANEFLTKVGAIGAASVTRQLMRKSMNGRGGGMLQGILIRSIAKMLPAKSVFAKTIPLLGGLISGVWNWRDSGRVGHRLRAYFAGRPLPADPE